MSNSVAPPATAPDPTGLAPMAPVESVEASRPAPPPSQDTADLRLLIEKDDEAGIFVYRIVDRRTGDVVQQFPRDQVLRLMGDPGYGPGMVFDARK